MNQYHKIQTVFKRDPQANYKTLLFGQYSLPEFEYLAMNEWSFTEKVDVLDLIIQTLNEHEQKLSEIVERLEALLLLQEAYPR